MKIEVDDEEKVTVTRDVERRGKVSESSFAQDRVVLCRIFPNGPERPSMCDRDVIEPSIGRYHDSVWAIDIYRHVTGVDLTFDS